MLVAGNSPGPQRYDPGLLQAEVAHGPQSSTFHIWPLLRHRRGALLNVPGEGCRGW